MWRVGRSTNPFNFSVSQAEGDINLRSGNRFDSSSGKFGVCYLSTDPCGAYAETLDKFRPDPRMEEFWETDDSMAFGELPREWRDERVLVHGTAMNTASRPFLDFVDVESRETRAVLDERLGRTLAEYGYSHITVPIVRGDDRRVTRAISEYLYNLDDDAGQHRYAGIRFLSKHDTNWECWAIFEGVNLERRSTSPITLQDSDFKKVTKLFKIKPH